MLVANALGLGYGGYVCKLGCFTLESFRFIAGFTQNLTIQQRRSPAKGIRNAMIIRDPTRIQLGRATLAITATSLEGDELHGLGELLPHGFGSLSRFGLSWTMARSWVVGCLTFWLAPVIWVVALCG